MSSKPYAFGDIVDGHRWTVLGWERLDGAPTTTRLEPVPLSEYPAPAPTPVTTSTTVAQDLVVVTEEPATEDPPPPATAVGDVEQAPPGRHLVVDLRDEPSTSGTIPTQPEAHWTSSESVVGFLEEIAVAGHDEPRPEPSADSPGSREGGWTTPAPDAGWYPGSWDIVEE